MSERLRVRWNKRQQAWACARCGGPITSTCCSMSCKECRLIDSNRTRTRARKTEARRRREHAALQTTVR